MINKHAYTDNAVYTCARWDIIDIELLSESKETNPFATSVGADFTNTDGFSLNVPGFYNDNDTWVIRFSPPDTGSWAFVTYSSLPEFAGLTGVVQATGPQPYEHGPLQPVPAKPQRLQYADGTPYNLLAFELDWLFALDVNNSIGIPKAKKLIGLMSDNGFNHVVMNVYAYDVTWKKDANLRTEHEYGAPDSFPFGGTNVTPDFNTLNVTFFQHIDRIMDALREAGIVAHLMIYVWNKLVNWPEMYSSADNMYFDYVVKRYQAFTNLVWDISKEALTYGRCDDTYVRERIHRLRKQDAYRRMLTVHDYDYCSRHPETIDMFSIQTWQSGLYDRMRKISETYPEMPVFNIEHGGYERSPYVVFPGDYDDPIVCLERNYECVFAGTYSTYYWQAASWNVVIHDPEALPEPQQPRFSYYKFLADFMQRYDFSRLKPTAGYNSSGYCLGNGEDTWLYLLPAGTYATHIGLTRFEEGAFKATWFFPLTGKYVAYGVSEIMPWREFLVPDATQMTVLIIEKTD